MATKIIAIIAITHIVVMRHIIRIIYIIAIMHIYIYIYIHIPGYRQEDREAADRRQREKFDNEGRKRVGGNKKKLLNA
jgi:hypothetical protein